MYYGVEDFIEKKIDKTANTLFGGIGQDIYNVKMRRDMKKMRQEMNTMRNNSMQMPSANISKKASFFNFPKPKKQKSNPVNTQPKVTIGLKDLDKKKIKSLINESADEDWEIGLDYIEPEGAYLRIEEAFPDVDFDLDAVDYVNKQIENTGRKRNIRVRW